MGSGGGRTEEPGLPGSDGTHSDFSGWAREVVQARDVRGGVHFHHSGPLPGPLPQQLPGDARGFVNRVSELAWLDEVMTRDANDPHSMNVLIIAGTAGVGKTSLAVHWAHRIRGRFPDGQLYVNLRGYDPGEPVAAEEALDRFLRALGVSADAIPDEPQAKESVYRSLVADRRMLVVLDNASSVRQVRPLLPGTPSCLVLVTSRSRLSGLVTRDGARRITVDMLAMPGAVELLSVVTSGYRDRDDPGDLSELAQLCARLPLALRIAAERAASRPQMPLRELISDLRDESGLWAALSAEDDEEADAVRTVFAWSYRALPPDAARLFCLLGLHPGPHFGVPAAASLAGISINSARSLLDLLVGMHLVTQSGPDRYQFHDLLRAYAAAQAQQLEQPDARDAARARLFDWYLHTADSVAAIMYPQWAQIQLAPISPGAVALPIANYEEARGWYDAEQESIVAVTRDAAARGMDQVAWQLPAVLRQIYADRNPASDWFTIGGIGLDAARRAGERYGEALILEALGRAARHSGRLADAVSIHEAAMSIWRDLGDRNGKARSINNLGLTYVAMRRFDEASTQFAAALGLATEIGDGRHSGIAAMNLGWVFGLQRDFPRSLELLRRALPVLRENSHRLHESSCLIYVAEAELQLGSPTEALNTAEAALEITRELGNKVFEARHLIEYARIQRASNEYAGALASYQQSASLYRGVGDRNQEAAALDGAGETYRESGQPELAAAFHRQAAAILRESGGRWELAVALDNLARALELTGDAPSAIAAWHETLPLITEFADHQAVGLRTRVEGKLSIQSALP
jgi:tetratricopeptide (TPR) repeat protein